MAKDCVSVITLLHGEREFCPLIRHNYQNFLETQTLQLVIVDDGAENLAKEFMDLENCVYLNIYAERKEFFQKILDGYKQPNKSPLYYQQRMNTLPNGFKRDYGSGMSEHPYIFHMNADCAYSAKAIDRKIRFMKRVSAECVYCDTTLCYDIYNDKLYKTESPFKIYDSTLCHTREFWKRRGFQWSDVEHEGKYFHYNNGCDRKMDNYYDTIQLLSIHNLNQYNPVEVTLDGVNAKPPDLVKDIKIETHPFVQTMRDLYGDDTIHLLGINSEFLENVSLDNWETRNITEKWKQTKLAKLVKSDRDSYNVLVYGSKYPAWDLFEKVPFDIVMLETRKNIEQMDGILAKCKINEYICVKGLYLRREFLENTDADDPDDPDEEESQAEKAEKSQEPVKSELIDGVMDAISEKSREESKESQEISEQS